MCPFKYHCIKRNFIISCKKVSFALKCGCHLFMISFTGNDLNKLRRYSRWPEIVTKNTSGLTRYIRLDQIESRFEFSIKSTPGGHKQRERPKLVVIFFVCVSAYGRVYLNDRMNGLLPRLGRGGEERGNWFRAVSNFIATILLVQSVHCLRLFS